MTTLIVYCVFHMKCEICGKTAHRTVCNKGKGNPKYHKICKDCCIRDGGHKCPWWTTCWEIKGV